MLFHICLIMCEPSEDAAVLWGLPMWLGLSSEFSGELQLFRIFFT